MTGWHGRMPFTRRVSRCKNRHQQNKTMNALNRPATATTKPAEWRAPLLGRPPEAVLGAKGLETKVKPAQAQVARRRIRFRLNVLNAQSVCVAGTFNGWEPGATPLTEVVRGNWFKYLRLAPGRYEYHFLVDGKRVDDPTARAYVSNPDGGRNAVLLVQ